MWNIALKIVVTAALSFAVKEALRRSFGQRPVVSRDEFENYKKSVELINKENEINGKRIDDLENGFSGLRERTRSAEERIGAIINTKVGE